MLLVHSQVSFRNLSPLRALCDGSPVCVCVCVVGTWLRREGEWGWGELEALLAEDTRGGPRGGSHSSSSVQGVSGSGVGPLEAGSRRRQTDKDRAQQPEGAGPAVRELWNLTPEQSLVALMP